MAVNPQMGNLEIPRLLCVGLLCLRHVLNIQTNLMVDEEDRIALRGKVISSGKDSVNKRRRESRKQMREGAEVDRLVSTGVVFSPASKPAAISITEVDDGDSDSGSDIFEGGIKETDMTILKRQSKKIREVFDDDVEM